MHPALTHLTFRLGVRISEVVPLKRGNIRLHDPTFGPHVEIAGAKRVRGSGDVYRGSGGAYKRKGKGVKKGTKMKEKKKEPVHRAPIPDVEDVTAPLDGVTTKQRALSFPPRLEAHRVPLSGVQVQPRCRALGGPGGAEGVRAGAEEVLRRKVHQPAHAQRQGVEPAQRSRLWGPPLPHLDVGPARGRSGASGAERPGYPGYSNGPLEA